MKMKKLLSMGALALVIASSTSVASFAAEANDAKLTDDERAIIVAMAKEYKNGDSFLDINKTTTTSSAIGINTGAIESKLGNYESGKRLLNHLDLNGNVNNNAHSVVEAIINRCKAASNPDDEFNNLKKEILNVETKIMDKAGATGEDRAHKEDELRKLLVNSYSHYNVNFGKDSDGGTTVSIESKEDDKIVLQVNTQEVEHISKVLSKLSLKELEDINEGKNISDQL